MIDYILKTKDYTCILKIHIITQVKLQYFKKLHKTTKVLSILIIKTFKAIPTNKEGRFIFHLYLISIIKDNFLSPALICEKGHLFKDEKVLNIFFL